MMSEERKREVRHLLEACHHTDNSELESEKTAVIQELLMEVERLEGGRDIGWRRLARILADVERVKGDYTAG